METQSILPTAEARKWTPEEITNFINEHPNFQDHYGEIWQVIQFGHYILVFVEQQGSRNHAFQFNLYENIDG